MAHYAFLDENNIVTEVIVGRDEDEGEDWESHYGEIRGQRCLRTSYNTLRNEHLTGGTPFRLNFAGIGYIYRDDLDGFIEPYPDYVSEWLVLDQTTGSWVYPSDPPDDGMFYRWDETIGEWYHPPNTYEYPPPDNDFYAWVWDIDSKSWIVNDWDDT